jgi:DNA-binding IclR family transcriptional regulator
LDTAAKLLSILRLFSLKKPAWTVEEAAREISVSVSSAYRYFRSLCKAGLLEPLNGNAYVLGPAIIEHDRYIRMSDPLIQAGRPAIQRLIDRSECPGVALLCRIYRNGVMCVDRERKSTADEALSYERGLPMPIFRGASSKAIFANLSPRSLRWFFKRNRVEIEKAGLGSDWETVKTNLRRLRKGRVVVAYGEVDPRRVGIAAPITDPKGNVIGSVSMVLHDQDATPVTVASISALVDAASREISVSLKVARLKTAEGGRKTVSSRKQSRVPNRRKPRAVSA